jgi:hypothetical protein
MEDVFPAECFCIARQMLTTCNAKESLAENAASPLAVGKSLSLVGIPAAG